MPTDVTALDGDRSELGCHDCEIAQKGERLPCAGALVVAKGPIEPGGIQPLQDRPVAGAQQDIGGLGF